MVLKQLARGAVQA